MANPEHLAILKQGAGQWNKWRKEREEAAPPDLKGANLRDTYLRGARLGRADLSEADLSGASLRAADLQRARLTGANLSGADLREADLRAAAVTETNFKQTIVSNTRFDDLDMSAAIGLEFVRHRGPSTIGIDTLYKSKGKIPEVFLRGCGVPDDMIGYIKSIAGAIQYYTCFISYSTKDQAFADRLYADLQAKGVR